MLRPDQNEVLTRTGPGSAMGRVFRSYWLPVLLSEELPAPDCPPVKVKILGEDLVAFRDSDGRVGLLEAACPHRGADLSYGRNEAGGLRCIFHGWKFDSEGTCLHMPNATAEEAAAMGVKARSYPTREAGGVVWAHLGAPAPPPPFREFGWMKVPAANRRNWKVLQEANFVQGLERDLDTAHTPTHRKLREQDRRDGRSLLDAVLPEYGASRIAVERTAYGLRSIATQPHPDGEHVRVTAFAMPCFLFVWPVPQSGDSRGFALVPRDDHSCWHFIFVSNAAKPVDPDYQKTRGLEHIGPGFRKLENPDNRHAQDRAAMAVDSFNGVRGIIIEDHMLAEIQGPVVDRSREHLVASDLPVVELRRMMLAAAEGMPAGMPLPGNDPDHPYHTIDGEEFVRA
jgi:nitrite reductase/ring-hydroxylating ferredoxin subunit